MKFGRGGSVRAFSSLVLVAGLIFLAACGGGGTPSGVPITIALTASPTSVAPGQSSTVTAAVANDSSNKGVGWSLSPSGSGTLSKQTTTSVVYTAPTTVSTATAVTITATSLASSTVTATVQIAVQSSAISVSLSPAAPQTIDQGQQLSVNATLTNDTGNKGVSWSLSPNLGTLSNPTTSAVTYIAPGVASNTAVTITATSLADSAAKAAVEITVFPSGAGPNVAALNVDSGPVGNSANLAFVSVTICQPGTTVCQTVDHVQVDTGSSGLRILQSAIPSLVLPTLMDTSTGNVIDNCVQFADTSYLWGAVQQADIKIGGEVASQALMQTISSSNSGIPTACSNGGTINENTATLLGANGIIGVGVEPTDCYVQGLINLCDNSVQAPVPAYFSCPSSGCGSSDSPIAINATSQVANPVVLFNIDNNGVVIQFPPVVSSAPTLSGSLIFGIGTTGNNSLGSATVFGMANNSFITLTNDGQNLISSVIDSGSNALFFPSALPTCADAAFFYCPAVLTPDTATNEGYPNQTPINVVNFNVDNADTLFNTGNNAFGTLAGPNGTPFTCNTSTGSGSCQFDWGLPFFFGRTVFTAIDNAPVEAGFGPFWAY
jgi:hypothetical protein